LPQGDCSAERVEAVLVGFVTGDAWGYTVVEMPGSLREGDVEACERCGAKAVDAAGRCGNCGWQAAPERDDTAVSSPSLAATRAVDAPDPASPARRMGMSSVSEFDRTMKNLPPARGASPAQPPARTTHGPGRASVPSARFCGVCGARITVGQAFCGQCGTPIAQGADEYGAAYAADMGAPSRYRVGVSGPWGEAQPDDQTEMYVPAQMGVSRPGAPGAGYGSPSYLPATHAPGQGQASAIESTRRTRIVIGLICIACGLASAAGAIIIAVAR
jgi:hypothetical protein